MLYILPPPTQSNPPSPWDLIINYHRTNGDQATSPNDDETNGDVDKPLQHSTTKLIKRKFTMFENLQNHQQLQDRLEKYKSNRINNHVREENT